MSKQLLVSIIVPVYNVKPYLNKCLDSLIAISYPRKEIIIVDDCSTDGSRDICELYTELTPNIKLIRHETNKGVQEARITGICNSSGDYVMFVDSDDYVYESILVDMLSAVDMHDAEMVSCGFLIERSGKLSKDIRNHDAIYNRERLEGWLSSNLFYDYNIHNHSMFPYTVGKLWKRDNLLKSFEHGRGLRYGEDMISVMDYLAHYVHVLVLIEKPLYVYVKHEGQQTSKSKLELIPAYLKYWDRLDTLNISEIRQQITGLIFRDIKPSLYDMRMKNGIVGKEYIRAFKEVRNNPSAIKYLFNNPDVPKPIKKHPHFILLKNRMYWLDYLMYLLLWYIPRD